MIDDTNTTVMMYPTNKTISIADKNVSGVNIGTNGAAFATNTIQIGNSNSKINLSGNVGIGTTTPGYKLDVVGDVRCSGDVIIGNNNNNDFGGRIYFGGTYGDNDYNHSQIVARKYGGTESSELLIYKGNDADDRIRLKAYMIEFDIAGSNTTDYSTSDIKMTLASNGCLGIGKRDPGYPLHVNGGFLGYSYGTNGGVYFSRDSGTNWAGASKPVIVGIYCPNWYWSDTGFIASSDRRIKKNIIDIQDNEALVVFRKIQPKIYDYIDVLQKGGDSVYGFIAQEVKDVFPQAVKMIKGTIPNFYTMCHVSQDIITLDTTKLEYDASGQVFPKLRLYRENDVELVVQILSIDGNTVKIDKTLTEDQVFVYGQEVDDFYALNKDAIWTVAAAALQEVDRQLQAEKQKTQTLQEEVQTLKQTCGLLKQTCASLQEENQQIRSSYEQLLTRILVLEAR